MSGLVAYGSSDEEDVTEQTPSTSRIGKVYGLLQLGVNDANVDPVTDSIDPRQLKR